ncbi:lactonase family protein [Luteococcus sp.]|uniref:lactonase family protein n=1 Tax=Luteococcus sp. TaxID=1969402 RepID=UPI0037356742
MEHSTPREQTSQPTTVLVGCYTDDEGTGGLQLVHADSEGLTATPVLDLPSPSWLELHDGRVLACSELAESLLSLVRIDQGEAQVLSQVPTGGAHACHLAVSPAGAWIAVAHYGSGEVTIHATPIDDALEGARGRLAFDGSGPDTERQDSSHAHQALWLDDEHVAVCDLGADQLHVVGVDGQGSPTLVTSVNLPAGTGPRHAVPWHDEATGSAVPLDGHLYLAIAGELSGRVVLVRHEGLDWSTGWWVGQQLSATSSPGQSQPSGLVWFGADLVLANRGTDELAMLAWRDGEHLQLVDLSPTGGSQTRDLREVDGQLWVANQDSDEVRRLRRAPDGFELVDAVAVTRPARLLPLA